MHDHSEHHNHHEHKTSLKKVSFMATLHCLTGCAIGEILGMVIGTALGWSDLQTIILAIILAFFFGYGLTIIPLLKADLNLKKALPLAFASDTVSITVMEVIDNLVIILIPGALHAHVTSLLFWSSLLFALVVAFIVTYPINMYLISKGKGHALVHSNH
jgi:formate/nitrite transporter FocA (FNT family)